METTTKSTCILTGATGEDPNDHHSHRHEIESVPGNDGQRNKRLRRLSQSLSHSCFTGIHDKCAEADGRCACECHVTKPTSDRWYLGSMNDGLAIINEPPAPAPVDHVNPNRTAPSLVIPLRNADRVTQEVAERIVSEHNAALARVCDLLECPMCGASKAFVINPLDGAVGYCVVEQMAWRVSAPNQRAWTRFSNETQPTKEN